MRLLSLALVAGLANAAPAPAAAAAPTITNEAGLSSALASLTKLTASPSAFYTSYAALYTNIKPSAAPTNAAGVASKLSSIYAARPSDFYGQGAEIALNGLATDNFLNVIQGFGACNSFTNSNPRNPNPPVYPKKSQNDAPYDLSENQLRSAIYIPSGFTYGQKPPVLFYPGTGVEACENFFPNYYQLLQGSSYADPVFVNVPNNTLDDIQTNAEYAAYAINYISGISNNANVSVVGWSQSSIANQWANKYWPSTRSIQSNLISISGDFHGTIEAPLLCPPGFPCPPSVIQQNYESLFIQTLRNNGGSSAYVPLTSSHTIFDEVVEPQQDPLASADIGNGNGVAVLNTQLQDVCNPATVAGSPNFGHEALLYNSPIFALHNDALMHPPGPANLARSGASTHCAEYFPAGLTLANVFATEALIPIAGFNIFTYPYKVTVEPAIRPYAQKDVPFGAVPST